LFKRNLNARDLAIGLMILVILVITLKPSGSDPPVPFSFSLGVGHRWLADGILNLILFIPLGAALAWGGRSPARAVVTAFLLSTAVELGQMWIPGRDPSLSDIVFNTAGGALGAVIGSRSRSWVNPRGSLSPALAILTTGGAALVLILTAILLTPANDAYITRRSGNDLVLEYSARSEALGLDQPMFWLPDLFHPGEESGRVTTRRAGARWIVSTASGSGGTIGPTPGQGWAVLAFSETRARSWGPMLSGAWMVCLGFLPGFFARGRLALVAALLLGVVLILVPVSAHLNPATTIEWIGVTFGFIAGAALGVASRRIYISSDGERLSQLRR
jgi:hypothetical protein